MTRKQLYAILLGSTALASSMSFNAMADVGIEPVPAYMDDNMAVGYAKKVVTIQHASIFRKRVVFP